MPAPLLIRAVSSVCVLALSVAACARSEPATDGASTPEELPTTWEVPPGDPLEHELAGFAKILCSALFVTGTPLEVAAEHDGHFVVTREARAQARDTVVDRSRKRVSVTAPSGVVRHAQFYGDQGCVTLPAGADSVYFTPVKVASALPPADRTPWPMGDVLPPGPDPDGVDLAAVRAAVDSAFALPDARTSAFVVTHKGRLIAERYEPGYDHQTRLPSWSMGKSLTATLMGLLLRQKVYDLRQPAPIAAWQQDGRKDIRIADILRMSSGLRFPAPQDPDYDRARGYPDHLYVYTGAIDAQQWSITRPQQWRPNAIGRYRNSDPLTINYLVRQAVEGRSEEYLSYPQRALFDKLGMRRMTPEPDPYGGFLLQGYELGSGRDWARLGNLYLSMGKAPNGEQLLDSSFVDFVRTPAPAWAKPEYGGFFWLNRVKTFPAVPDDAYYMAGAGGQYTIVIPTHDLVVVRIGHYTGAEAGAKTLNAALAVLMSAIPQVREPWVPTLDR
jgi:CubicO group peptidase (beta-lactamase class C family)